MARGNGIYAAQFPDRVKIGASALLRTRLTCHRARGATRIVAVTFPMTGDRDGLEDTETAALAAAGRLGRRLGASEEFADLPFEAAVELLLDAATAQHGGPARLVEVI